MANANSELEVCSKTVRTHFLLGWVTRVFHKHTTLTILPILVSVGLGFRVMTGPGFIPTGVNICHSIFLFSHSKASDANISIIANLV